MARNDTERIALGNINSNGKGRPYENLMAEAMAAYCIKNGIEFRKVTGGPEDKYGGTDFRIYSCLDLLTADAGILRMDFTAAFSHKDNMPLIWTPESPIMQLKGTPLKFGIRTGNKAHGFDYPVVVLGVDASRNEGDSGDIDVELVSGQIMSNAVKYAPAIISESGSALSAYVQMTNPDYAAWLESDEAASLDLLLPEANLLSPNYEGLRGFKTDRPTGETRRGIQAARQLAFDSMLAHPAGSHEHETAKKFASDAGSLVQIRTSGKRRRGDPAKWLEDLVKTQDAVRERDRSDGLTK